MAHRLPVTYEYSVELQYEFAKGWVADLGYVGTHSIHVYNYFQDINVAQLVPGAPKQSDRSFRSPEHRDDCLFAAV